MKKGFLFLSTFFLARTLAADSLPAAPDQVYGVLFEDIQRGRIFSDGKVFPDCVPKRDPMEIVAAYLRAKSDETRPLDLKKFVSENFLVPETQSLLVPKDDDVVHHIESMWTLLRRNADTAVKGSSLLPLPYPYVVPGGRFREIYYWDSYFTLLGLRESGREDLIESMIANFADLISRFGHIPNGNRTYYLSRSQPPFFALMIEFLAEKQGDSVYAKYLPALRAEYDYWMDRTMPTHHVVTMPDGSRLNRYYDQRDTPRTEAFYEDEQTAQHSGRRRETVGRDLRSAAESGWDFSSRWFSDGKTLETTDTINIVPVDLNCLLYQLETTLAKAYGLTRNAVDQHHFEETLALRKAALIRYCWSGDQNFFVDYEIGAARQSPRLSLAGVTPLFCGLASNEQARSVARVIEEKFLKPGGVVTTLVATGQQWDAPNGWAPLEWLTIHGLERYGQHALAEEIARRWIKLNRDVYQRTGKLMEKYNVADVNLTAGGGEYPSQDGFGWTNGVLLKLIHSYP
ncbi:MAG TPA: alpha,alpha-trehalase TreF [Opitutaceae bacterium]|nr:alpha,alpha-trehalase TreF [Opitutaceae bacterium]